MASRSDQRHQVAAEGVARRCVECGAPASSALCGPCVEQLVDSKIVVLDSSPSPVTHTRARPHIDRWPAGHQVSTFPRGGHVVVVHLGPVEGVSAAGPTVHSVAATAQRITFVCQPDAVTTARRVPGVHLVQPFDAAWVSRGAEAATGRALSTFVQRLWERTPDRALVLDAGEASAPLVALPLRMAGVTHIAAATNDDAPGLLDIRLRPPEGSDEAAHLALAIAAGFPFPAPTDPLTRRRTEQRVGQSSSRVMSAATRSPDRTAPSM